MTTTTIPAAEAKPSLEDVKRIITAMESLQAGTILNPPGTVRLNVKDLVAEGRP